MRSTSSITASAPSVPSSCNALRRAATQALLAAASRCCASSPCFPSAPSPSACAAARAASAASPADASPAAAAVYSASALCVTSITPSLDARPSMRSCVVRRRVSLGV
eukprot:5436256-Pleurochrysis_carterae.AAC.1